MGHFMGGIDTLWEDVVEGVVWEGGGEVAEAAEGEGAVGVEEEGGGGEAAEGGGELGGEEELTWRKNPERAKRFGNCGPV